MQGFQNILPLLINGTKMPRDASILPEAVQFFPNLDAYVFPEQYINSPFYVLCKALLSKNDGKNGFRGIYNSSPLFNADQSLEDLLSRAQNGDTRQPAQGYAVHVLYRARRIQKGGADLADTYPSAANQLGMLHFHPTGSFKKDIPRSIEFFETAARQGHVLSAAELALIYQIPEYHNYEKAFNYSKYAAEALMLLRQMDDLKI